MNAPVEANQSYSTPQVVEFNGLETIVIAGADYITAHAASDGSEIWRVGSLNPKQDQYFRSISSPVVAGGIVVAPYARGTTLTTVRLGGQGDVTDSHVLWTKESTSADVPTPAAADGRVIVLTDKGQIVCLDIASGNQIWELSEPGEESVSAGKSILTRE